MRRLYFSRHWMPALLVMAWLMAAQASYGYLQIIGDGIHSASNVGLGEVLLGTSVEKTFTVQNTDAEPALNTSVKFTSVYRTLEVKVIQDLPAKLDPGEKATVTVRFTGKRIGFDDVLVFATATGTQPARIDVYATVGTRELLIADTQWRPISTTTDNTVVAWGYNDKGQTNVPAGLGNAVAISAGDAHTIVLKADGGVVAWGDDHYGQTKVPADLNGVTAIAAGYTHNLALKADGSVVAWGNNEFGQAKVPANLGNAVGISAGGHHSIAVRRDGTVIAWGSNNTHQCDVPKGLSDVIAVAAGGTHSVALKGNGTIVAWGDNSQGQCNVPKNVNILGVMAIAAGATHTVAHQRYGQISGWGFPYNPKGTASFDFGRYANCSAMAAGGGTVLGSLSSSDALQEWTGGVLQTTRSPLQGRVLALAAGGHHSAAIALPYGDFGNASMTQYRKQLSIRLHNLGTFALDDVKATITGPDANLFLLRNYGTIPYIGRGYDGSIDVECVIQRPGPASAVLTITSKGLARPFVLPLTVKHTFEARANSPTDGGSNFTYGPLTLDRSTGLLNQQVIFVNYSRITLPGLRLELTNIPSGLTVASSSASDKPRTVEVLYTQPIPYASLIAFNLSYFAPQRRATLPDTFRMNAEALDAPEPQPGPVNGTLINLLGVRDTPSGPLLEWNTVRNALYVVEYSDDGGASWHAAVHRLGTGGTRMLWVDRGQPETQTKPANKAARLYRVKRV